MNVPTDPNSNGRTGSSRLLAMDVRVYSLATLVNFLLSVATADSNPQSQQNLVRRSTFGPLAPKELSVKSVALSFMP
jgi:hypothetical protein